MSNVLALGEPPFGREKSWLKSVEHSKVWSWEWAWVNDPPVGPGRELNTKPVQCSTLHYFFCISWFCVTRLMEVLADTFNHFILPVWSAVDCVIIQKHQDVFVVFYFAMEVGNFVTEPSVWCMMVLHLWPLRFWDCTEALHYGSESAETITVHTSS